MNEFELRQHLRSLPRDRNPDRDLWPQIAAAIGAAPRARRRHTPLWPLALAASLLLAVLFVLQAGLSRQAESPLPQDAWIAEYNRRQAEALTLEYRAALMQLPPPAADAQLRVLMDDLDAQADAIRGAIDAQPQAQFLLGQLRRTYESRLRVAQLAATG